MRLQMGYKPGLKFLYFVNVPKQRGFGRFRGLFSKNTKIWRDFGGGCVFAGETSGRCDVSYFCAIFSCSCFVFLIKKCIFATQ